MPHRNFVPTFHLASFKIRVVWFILIVTFLKEQYLSCIFLSSKRVVLEIYKHINVCRPVKLLFPKHGFDQSDTFCVIARNDIIL